MQVTAYKAKDGKLFETEEAQKKYDVEWLHRMASKKIAQCMFDNCESDDGYINSPEELERLLVDAAKKRPKDFANLLIPIPEFKKGKLLDVVATKPKAKLSKRSRKVMP